MAMSGCLLNSSSLCYLPVDYLGRYCSIAIEEQVIDGAGDIRCTYIKTATRSFRLTANWILEFQTLPRLGNRVSPLTVGSRNRCTHGHTDHHGDYGSDQGSLTSCGAQIPDPRISGEDGSGKLSFMDS